MASRFVAAATWQCYAQVRLAHDMAAYKCDAHIPTCNTTPADLFHRNSSKNPRFPRSLVTKSLIVPKHWPMHACRTSPTHVDRMLKNAALNKDIREAHQPRTHSLSSSSHTRTAKACSFALGTCMGTGRRLRLVAAPFHNHAGPERRIIAANHIERQPAATESALAGAWRVPLFKRWRYR